MAHTRFSVSKILQLSYSLEKNVMFIPFTWPRHRITTLLKFENFIETVETIKNFLTETCHVIMNQDDFPDQLFLEGSSNSLSYLCVCYCNIKKHEEKFASMCKSALVAEILRILNCEICHAFSQQVGRFTNQKVC